MRRFEDVGVNLAMITCVAVNSGAQKDEIERSRTGSSSST